MSRYLELSLIQHAFNTYTQKNVHVNIFCNYAGCQVHGSRFTVVCLIFILVYVHSFLTLNCEPLNFEPE